MNVHRSNERGSFSNTWLKTKYSFSFSSYFNPERMGCGRLRVLNDDIITKGGFPEHEHDNMEIVTIVLRGELKHKDSMGNVSSLKEGELQFMSAGSGITHSEFADYCELFQLWIVPKERYTEPKYFNVTLNSEFSQIDLPIDGKIFYGKVTNLEYTPEKKCFVMVVEGEVKINGIELGMRDSIETTEKIVVDGYAVLLLVDS